MDLSLAVSNEVIASISSDRLVKFHRLADQHEDIFSLSTMSKNISVDIHPIGFQVALGFKDGFRIFYLLDNALNQVFESYCKQCTQTKYSVRGDMLALASGNYIFVYDPYSFEKIVEINAHANNISQILYVYECI